MKVWVYPGSFDPVTNGHLDIIDRASKLCDKLIVAVLLNSSKNPSFSVDERISFLKRVSKDYNNIEITSFSGLLIDFMNVKKANVIIKGLRAVSDFEYELQMALL
ncbi:MAG: pantetheine-phosphate adenylyltransferase, partial [Clostridiales bacterium]|nr:pantetheine-phosphate adenylyltransferase [Clostridiales bacterium]